MRHGYWRSLGCALAIALAASCGVPEIHVVPSSTNGARDAGRGGEGGAGGEPEAGDGDAPVAEGGRGGAAAHGGEAGAGRGGRGGSGSAGSAGGGAGGYDSGGAGAGGRNVGGSGGGAGTGGLEAGAAAGGVTGGAGAGAGVGGAGGGSVPDPCAVWTRATSADAAPPDSALQAGLETHEGVDYAQYICRARVPINANAYSVGKMIFGHQCYVTFLLDGSVAQYTAASSTEVEVLTPPSGCTLDWQTVGASTRPRVNLAPDGSSAMYSCRGYYSSADSSGTQVGSVLPQAMREGCFFEAWGQVAEPQTPNVFDVLVRVTPP